MNISYNWLKEYITHNLSPQELANALTSIGLETGSVELVQSIKGGLEGLVIGEVLTCVPHPNSDHLHLTTVDIGSQTLSIVCGAPNVKAGQKVIVATIGTTLYTDEGSFTIKKSKIRGEESLGMLCAEDEIGVGKGHDGIMVLPDEAVVGTPARDYFGITDDYLLEIDITPNRVDATSHIGVARDLFAFLKQTDPKVTLQLPQISTITENEYQESAVSVHVEEPALCPRYCGVTIRNVEVKESPEWLKNKLQTIGVSSINNIVDITNFVLHEQGHPLHAFDLDKIENNQIIVKRPKDEVDFTTLDGSQKTLQPDDLLIFDSNRPLCIAGVLGGKQSGVSLNTQNIFLECAYFAPTTVRKTARRHALSTDSSFRFERGCDPNDTLHVLKRAINLIQEVAGGQIAGEIIDFYPHPIEKPSFTLSFEEVDALIGQKIARTTIKNILQLLDIDILSESDNSLHIAIPTYRVDVTRPVDVIEEILRIYGYNRIEFDHTLKGTLSQQTHSDHSYNQQKLISEQLTGAGFLEILNNSLSKEGYYQNNPDFPLNNCVKLLNPLSTDLGVMRQTLLFGGLENIAYNQNRQAPNLRFYEFGNVYHLSQNDSICQASETFNLGLWLSGNTSSASWNRTPEKFTIYHLKGYVENILTRLGVDSSSIQYQNTNNELFGASVILSTKKKPIGIMGSISQKVKKQLEISNDVFFAELNWSELMKLSRKHHVVYQDIPKYPEVKRDFSLLIDKQVTFADIEALSKKTEKKLLKKITLFDVYEGEKLPEGKKSYAVSFTLQDKEKTLNDKAIDNVMKKIYTALEKELGATLR